MEAPVTTTTFPSISMPTLVSPGAQPSQWLIESDRSPAPSFVSGYRFSDTESPSKSDAPLGAEHRIPTFSALCLAAEATLSTREIVSIFISAGVIETNLNVTIKS
jgi:hypothetical protein